MTSGDRDISKWFEFQLGLIAASAVDGTLREDARDLGVDKAFDEGFHAGVKGGLVELA
ncbi:MAG: hypothetical protein GKR94_21400 [Gammaproteobacteria bacterium]|nr:hypothetical protein [Gammaproteobacteria bacterium]